VNGGVPALKKRTGATGNNSLGRSKSGEAMAGFDLGGLFGPGHLPGYLSPTASVRHPKVAVCLKSYRDALRTVRTVP